MQISVNIIMDYIRDFNPQVHIDNTDTSFSGVSIATKSSQGLFSAQIYVCALKDFLEIQNRDRKISLIIVKKPDEEIPYDYSLYNTIVVDFKGEMIDFFSYLQSIFSLLYNWSSKMDEYLIKKRSIQEILSLSESVLQNTITISDSSFALVAYTEGIECDDRFTSKLIKNGYHDQAAIDRFNKLKLPEYWKDTVDIYVNDSKTVTDYPIMCKVIHYYNNYFAHIVMVCNNRVPSPGLRDLFKILVDHMVVCFEVQWNSNNQMPHIHDNLLITLTGPNTMSEEAARNRARNSGLPFQSNFRFLKIVTPESSNIMLQRIEREIIGAIPDAKVTLHQQSLLVLISQPPKNTDKFDELLTHIRKILNMYNALCGISDRFSILTDVRLAHEQAKLALSYAKTTEAIEFEDCYLKVLLTSDPQIAYLMQNSQAYLKLKEIEAYDLKHGTNNFELLSTYLNFDRKATETAEVMHMHRNNIIYRISRLCEQTGLDLNEPSVRLRLMVAFEIFKKQVNENGGENA